HTGCARTDRLLLDAADRADRAVRTDLAGRGDLVAVDDVTAHLLEHLEREGETGRGAADVPGVDPNRERKLDVDRRLDRDADDRAVGRRARGDGGHPLQERLLAAPDRDSHGLTDLHATHHLEDILRARAAPAVAGGDPVL